MVTVCGRSEVLTVSKLSSSFLLLLCFLGAFLHTELALINQATPTNHTHNSLVRREGEFNDLVWLFCLCPAHTTVLPTHQLGTGQHRHRGSTPCRGRWVGGAWRPLGMQSDGKLGPKYLGVENGCGQRSTSEQNTAYLFVVEGQSCQS